MGKGKQKPPQKVSGKSRSQDQRALRNTVETAVNEGVKIQDAANGLPATEASAALVGAEAKYREALNSIKDHPDAAYNLATCLSERADLETVSASGGSWFLKKLPLLQEAISILEGVIERDTSGRGATTALAHQALGNMIRSMVDAQEENRLQLDSERKHDYPTVAEQMDRLRRSCRHFEESLAIRKRAPNPPGGADEVLVHWGDTLARIMAMVMDENVGVGEHGTQPRRRYPWQPPPPSQVQQALQLCSDTCAKYSEALAMAVSSDESDIDTLLRTAGAVVDFLEWALPEALDPSTGGAFSFSFEAETVLSAGEQAMETIFGLECDHQGGLLAKGDLCRLRARKALLGGSGLEEEARWWEASYQHVARALRTPHSDPEEMATVVATAGESFLGYARRFLEIFEQLTLASRTGSGPGTPPCIPPGWSIEAIRASALERLQEARVLLSRAIAASTTEADVSDSESVFNLACAFSLEGNQVGCRDALAEYLRRLLARAQTAALKDRARQALIDVVEDGDLKSVKEEGWFVELIGNANRTLG